MKKGKSNNNKEKALIKRNNNEEKENFGTKFINIIKKRWLISSTNTILLIAILIAIVVLINSFVQSLEITPIDCTSNKQYTLSKESKERVSNIEKSLKIYMVGYEESEKAVTLVKQYNKANKNIEVEVIDANERTDIASKYNVTNDYPTIIIENGDNSKIIYNEDLYTYDSNYSTVDLTEEKVTSSILSIIADKIPTAYFLTGYSEYNFDSKGGMNYLSAYLKDEVLNFETLNMLTKGSIPENCDTLIIYTPTKDFDELTTNEIIKYINNGGNILWLNGSYAQKVKLDNVNKILALYGINPFEVGYIYETNSERTVLGYRSCIVEKLGNTKIDKNLSDIILLTPTKINVNDEAISDLGITQQIMIQSSESSYFRKDVSNTSTSTANDEQGMYTIGGIFTKTLSNENNEENEENQEENKEELKSQLVIIGDDNFISDIQLAEGINPMIFLGNNKDVMLNSVAYLTEQDVDITIRKNNTKASSFTATDAQRAVIIRVIFMVPIGIMLFGFVVWQVRRRRG